MTTRTNGPDTGSHPTHDRLLIAAHAAGDLIQPELARAEALLAGCADCRALDADLRQIALAVHDLPPPLLHARRDFRIPSDRAADLVRGAGWRRLLRPFGRSGAATRPLALAFTTLGVAGLLLASLPSLQLGGTGALMADRPEPTDTRNAAYATPEPDSLPPVDTSGGEEAPGDAEGQVGAGGQGAPEATAAPTTIEKNLVDAALPDSTGSPSALLILSIAFLGAGLGLLVLRKTALRLR